MEGSFTPGELALLLSGLAVLFLLSAFFSASETALMGFDWLRLRFLARKGNRRAKHLERLLSRKDRLIATILVGNNIVNIGASAVATAVAIEFWGESGIAIATGAMTFLILVFSEISPKVFASRHVEGVGLAVAPVHAVLVRILFPVAATAMSLSNALLWLFGSRAKVPAGPVVSEEELRALLSETSPSFSVDPARRRMLHGVFQMSRKTVREVMIPRTRVLALDISADLAETAERIIKTGHTRLPVYRETLDDVVGVVHARDVLDLVSGRRQGGLGSVLREPLYVPEMMTLENLLYEFKRRQTHLALVVDEFGGVEGLATLEDVIEEIVGDIRDEHDLEGQTIRFLPGGEALVLGLASIHDVNEALNLALPTEPDVTLGGFVTTRLSHIPDAGESFDHEGLRFTVERMSRHRVHLIRITPLEEKD